MSNNSQFPFQTAPFSLANQSTIFATSGLHLLIRSTLSLHAVFPPKGPTSHIMSRTISTNKLMKLHLCHAVPKISGIFDLVMHQALHYASILISTQTIILRAVLSAYVPSKLANRFIRQKAKSNGNLSEYILIFAALILHQKETQFMSLHFSTNLHTGAG